MWGTWTLALLVLALIGVAVGDELAIAHPGDEATLGFTILTFGGPALFLLAQILFLREALGHVPLSRSLSLAALAVLAVATAPLTLIVGIAASSAVLVAVAIADTIGEGDRAPGPGSRSATRAISGRSSRSPGRTGASPVSPRSRPVAPAPRRIVVAGEGD